MRGVMCHIYTCIEREEVGEGGEGRGGQGSCDRTLLPQKSIGLSVACVASGSEL